MEKDKEKTPPIARLKYKGGDLIIKEGDFGISIYKIVTGRVRIFNESDGKEIGLATLGPGEVIGEMTFLNRATEPRSASARALEETEMEVWHPARLSKEYEQMPPILKYIAGQVIRRIVRMNQLIGRLSSTAREKPVQPSGEDKSSERLYYRKALNRECTYRPVGAPPRVKLVGQIKDISLTGVGLEVGARNALNFSHDAGSEFVIKTVLPNGKELDVTARVVYVKKDWKPGRIFMGMEITHLGDDDRKTLGFFLLP